MSMDAYISVDLEGVPHISLLSEKAYDWFIHHYHASFLTNHMVKDATPFKFLGHLPQEIYEDMIDAGLDVSMRKISQW